MSSSTVFNLKDHKHNILINFSSRYSGNLSTGLIFDADKTAMLLEGGVQQWYCLKNTIKQHITCTGSKVHFEALQVK
jgi:hypothetical protein